MSITGITADFSGLRTDDDLREPTDAQSENNVNLGLVGMAYHSNCQSAIPGDWRSLVRWNPVLHNVFIATDLWRKVFDQEKLPYFDEVKCRKYRGEPGKVPFLSWLAAYRYFHSPCPLFPGELVKDTHKLQLFYKELDGIPMSLNHAGKLAKNPKTGSEGLTACFHKYSWPEAFLVLGEEPLRESFWAFVAVKQLDGTFGVSTEEKLKRIANHPQYRLHRTVEKSIANFDNVVETGLYLDGDGFYSICEETLGEKKILLAVGGGRARYGLFVSGEISNGGAGGVALLREF